MRRPGGLIRRIQRPLSGNSQRARKVANCRGVEDQEEGLLSFRRTEGITPSRSLGAMWSCRGVTRRRFLPAWAAARSICGAAGCRITAVASNPSTKPASTRSSSRPRISTRRPEAGEGTSKVAGPANASTSSSLPHSPPTPDRPMSSRRSARVRDRYPGQGEDHSRQTHQVETRLVLLSFSTFRIETRPSSRGHVLRLDHFNSNLSG